MKIIILAQNIPYLLSLGVPEANAQPILDYISTIDKKDRGKILPQIKKNPNVTVDELKGFKIITPEERAKAELEKRSGSIMSYVGSLLEEDKKTIMSEIEKNPDMTTEQIKEALKKIKLPTPEEAVEWANKIAPKYLDWLVKQAKTREVDIRGEDDESIKETMDNFDIIKRQGDFPKENRDINLYPKYSELLALVLDLMPEKVPVVVNKDDPGIVYNKDGVKVIKATDKQKIVDLSEGTGGCTKNDYNVESYQRDGKEFYFVFVDEVRTAIIHQGSQQLKNDLNQPLNNYTIIKRIHPVLSELGIAPDPKVDSDTNYRSDRDYDYTAYNRMLGLGQTINEELMASTNKLATLTELQRRFADKQPSRAVTFGSGASNDNVVFFVSDELFEDEGIKKYAKELYFRIVEDQWHRRPLFGESGAYKRFPYPVRLIPEVREYNKTKAIENFEEDENNVYKDIGRELKVYKEVIEAHFNFWKKKIVDDPFAYEKAEFPPAFAERLKPLYLDVVVQKLKRGPDGNATKVEDGSIVFPMYDRLPENLKEDAKVKAAYREGMLAFTLNNVERSAILPEEFRNDPEFVEQNRRGWENYLVNNLDAIEAGPTPSDVTSLRNKETGTVKIKKYEILPDEFKNRPEVKAALRKGYLNFARKSMDLAMLLPPEFKNDPEFIEMNRKGWEDYVKNALPVIERGPETYYAKEGIRNNPDNPKIILPEYDKLPDEFKNKPEVKEAYKRGVEKLVSVYLSYSKSIPEYIANDPNFSETLKMSWFQFISDNGERFVNPRSTWNGSHVYKFAPDSVKQSEYWDEILNEVVIGYYKKFVAEDLSRYNTGMIPEELKSNPELVKYVESKVLPIMKDNPSEYFSLGTSFRNLPRVKAIEKQTYMPIWTSKIKNGDVYFYETLPTNAREIPELKNAYRYATASETVSFIEDPQLNEAVPTGRVLIDRYAELPDDIRNSPRVKKYLQTRILPAWINAVRDIEGEIGIMFEGDSKNNLNRIIKIMPPEIARDPTIQKHLSSCRKKLGMEEPVEQLAPQVAPQQQVIPQNLKKQPAKQRPVRQPVRQPAQQPVEQPIEENDNEPIEAKNWYLIMKMGQIDRLKETKEIEALDNIELKDI